MFHVLGSLLFFNLLGAFLAWLSRRWFEQADANTAWCTSGKISIAMKDNTAFDRTDLRFLYYTENSHEFLHWYKSSILVNIA